MRRLAIVVAVAGLASGICIAGITAAAAQVQPFTPIVPETSTVTSTVTNCMMRCNSAVSLCQNNCVVPGALGPASTSNVSAATTSCQLTCTTTQLTCQSICAQQSPSR